mmetsp:Transcript_19925/g.79666  ORF Transcript_19925/g.79666 Transcript_19925/m.79666 type:complete len:125 (+) Transcript_19925:1578-1952(+)
MCPAPEYSVPLLKGGNCFSNSKARIMDRQPTASKYVISRHEGFFERGKISLEPDFQDDDSPAKTDIISLGYSDASAVYCQFPQWSRFLGAEVLFDATNSKQTEQASSSPLVLAKDFFLQVKWLT